MSSKKNVMLVLLFSVLTLTLTGCGKSATTWENNKVPSNNSTWEVVATTPEPTKWGKGDMKCIFTDTNWEITNAYIRWAAIYFEAVDKATNKTTKWLSKDDKMYFWSATDAKWFTIDLKAIQSADKQWTSSTQDLINKAQTWDSTCTAEDAPDLIFELPADIVF